MTPTQLRQLRESLSLTPLQFARLLGYQSQPKAAQITIYRFESGTRPIPRHLAARLQMMITKS